MNNEQQDLTEDIYQFPLSFSQQRLWLFDQLQPGSTAYNITTALRLAGTLDVAALEAALAQIVQRHEILRTTFADYQGEPSQWIRPAIGFNLEKQLLPPAPLERQLKQAEAVALSRAGHVFDLRQGPLLNVVLLTLADDSHVLVSVVHHIISDGWSMGVFMRELAAFYTAQIQGHISSGLPALAIQYGDYALWQREWFVGDIRDRQLSYWQTQLANVPPLLMLPTDKPRPPVQSFAGATWDAALSAQTTAALKQLAAAEGATLNMVLMAAFLVLLHRYSEESDMVIGTPVANRNQLELEPLIGFFANTLVIRADVEPQMSFRDLLRQLKATALAAYEHQDCPFEQLLDVLRPERSLSYSPLIQVFFTFQSASDQTFELPGVSISQLPLPRDNSQFDLAVVAAEQVDGVSLEFGYCTDLFYSDTIKDMAGHFVNLCTHAAARPDIRLGAVPLLAAHDYRTIVQAWNQNRELPLRYATVLDAVDAQIERTPDAVAVVCTGHTLTYRELAERSVRVAKVLMARGVKNGDLVGLCLERSLDMVIALLGILKAGAAYVPMDPHYPEQRLKLIVAGAGLQVVVAQQALAPLLAGLQADAGQLGVYHIEELLAAEAGLGALPKLSGEQLVYIIFTSGSTGTPKAAAIQHKGFANMVLHWYCEKFALQQAFSTLLCTSLSFDLTQKTIFAPLIFGGVLHLYAEAQYDPEQIVKLIESHHVGWFSTTPSAFYPLADAVAARPQALQSLRTVFLGGETIVFSRMQPWLDYAKGRTDIVNAYGPTECSDVCMAFHVDDPGRYVHKNVPLGVTIDNDRVYILDEGLNPVPMGLSGQLCVGGLGVGIGFLNDSRRTAELFLPDEFSVMPGARMYKSGDRVRFTRDGNFEFLCRTDHQVKVRGFRIDLGEIELVLNAHPQVQESVVMAGDNGAGDKFLSAYLVTGAAVPGSAELRDYVAQRLPHYMVPQYWLMLAKMPLTPSGKVDRRALPSPLEAGVAEPGSECRMPENEIEEHLLAIWQAVLDLPVIGTTQNFFELGGHSLNATQVVARIKQVFAVEMPMRVVFEHPTIIQLADWILAAQFDALNAGDQADLLAELEGLSDDALAALLSG